MKKILGAMIAMFMLIVWPGAAIWIFLFSRILGGGIAESYLYPIYGGIILLTGVIVGCTVVIIDEIKSLKNEIRSTEKSDTEMER